MLTKTQKLHRNLLDAGLIGYEDPGTGAPISRYLETTQLPGTPSALIGGGIGAGIGGLAAGADALVERKGKKLFSRLGGRYGRIGVPIALAAAAGVASGLLANKPKTRVFDPDTGDVLTDDQADLALQIQGAMDPDDIQGAAPISVAPAGLDLGGDNDPDFAWIADLDGPDMV